MRWTRGCRKTGGASRGRRSRVVLTPRRWRQAGGSNSAGDGGKKARSPGRARSKPLKPLRREGRVFPAVSVVTMLVWFFHFHARLRVHRAPGFPCALCFRGRKFLHNPGASRRGKAAVCLQSEHRHCERSEAIHSFFARQPWIASSQALLAMTATSAMDCFAEPVIGRAFARPVGSQ